MQTVKPRARYLGGSGGPMWEVTHPATRVSVWATWPRDGAAMLLERYVVPRQCETRNGVKA